MAARKRSTKLVEPPANNPGYTVVVSVSLDEAQSPPAARQVRTGTYSTHEAAMTAAESDCDRLGGYGFHIRGTQA